VVAIKPLFEAGKNYAIDGEFDVPPEHAVRLQELGLVRILDPNAPRLAKLQAARQRWTEAEHSLSARRKELAAIEDDVRHAEERVAALRVGLNATDGLASARAAQDALAEGERDLEAKRQLQKNQQRRVLEAGRREQESSKTVRDIERRITELKAAIPIQEANVASHRQEIEQLLRKAEAYRGNALRPAEAQLEALRGELKALEG
jgi:chromosome segregation ATPase